MYTKTIIILMTLFTCYSCRIVENKPFTLSGKNQKVLTRYIINKLNKNNSLRTNKKDIEIWAVPVSSVKNFNAVYNFGRVGSSFSKKNFFIYTNNKIKFLDENDTTKMQEALNKFFVTNEYSQSESTLCLERIKQILEEPNESIF